MPQNPTPDTMSYLILGLATITVFMAVFVMSLVVRYRNLRRDAELIAQLEQDERR